MNKPYIRYNSDYVANFITENHDNIVSLFSSSQSGNDASMGTEELYNKSQLISPEISVGELVQGCVSRKMTRRFCKTGIGIRVFGIADLIRIRRQKCIVFDHSDHEIRSK